MEQSIPKKLGMFALLTAGSLFAQTLLWVAYDYFRMQVWVMGALPLLICLLYHAVQLDSGTDKLMGRRFVFAGACLLPLLLGAALGLWMYWKYPGLEVFGGTGWGGGVIQETIAKYSARYLLTSGYLILFAGLDAVYLLRRT